MHGGAADRSGLISVGDEVIEVNGVNVEGQTPNDVLKILVSLYYSKKKEWGKLKNMYCNIGFVKQKNTYL